MYFPGNIISIDDNQEYLAVRIERWQDSFINTDSLRNQIYSGKKVQRLIHML